MLGSQAAQDIVENLLLSTTRQKVPLPVLGCTNRRFSGTPAWKRRFTKSFFWDKSSSSRSLGRVIWGCGVVVDRLLNGLVDIDLYKVLTSLGLACLFDKLAVRLVNSTTRA